MKTLKKTILFLLICSMLTETINISAAGESFSFTFYNKIHKQQTESYPKEDNEQNAYVTIQDTVGDDFTEGDVFGCRVRKASNESAVTDYTLMTQYGRYVLPYTSTGYTGTEYFLRGQIDSSGEYSFMIIGGVWLP